MGSRAMLYIPSFIKTFWNSKVNGGGGQTHREHGHHISLLSSFQNKERRLENKEHFEMYTKL
jgi:hypothetical protein